MTHEDYRLNFGQERMERDESPSQFTARLLNYMKKCIRLANVDETSPSRVSDNFVREKFLDACPQELLDFCGRSHSRA